MRPAAAEQAHSSCSSAVSGPTRTAGPPNALVHGRSFDALVHEHGGRVRRSLRYLGVRAADLEDVYRETFMVVLERLST